MSIPENHEYQTWIRQSKQNPNPKLRLFCFPYAGGGASLFRLWDENLPGEIEVCPVQFPGRESRIREPLFEALNPLIEKLAQVLSPGFDIPFAFFGYSLGALVAFELSRWIRKTKNILPAKIIVAACPAPHLPETHPPIHELPREEFVRSLREMDGTPDAVFLDPELIDFFIPLLRADFKIYETYRYQSQAPLNCPISAYGGLADDSVTMEATQAWEEHTSASFIRRMFPGNHYFLRENTRFLYKAILDDLSGFIN